MVAMVKKLSDWQHAASLIIIGGGIEAG